VHIVGLKRDGCSPFIKPTYVLAFLCLRLGCGARVFWDLKFVDLENLKINKNSPNDFLLPRRKP